MSSLAHTLPKRAQRRARARSSSRDGYVLVPVVMGLLLIALAALVLNNESVINAAEVGSLHDAARAEHVARSGMERAIWRAEHDACGGDFTIAATALGSDQYEVTTTGGGSSTSYVLSADQDAWIRNDDPTRNNGSSSWNHIRFEGGNTEQVLTRFDLSGVPGGAQIQSATAWFYVKNLKPHSEGPITVHAIAADWGELTVTWDSFGGQFSNDRLSTIPAQDTGAVWVGINLTAQVQAWVNGAPNYGILFRSTSDGTHTEYTGRAEGTNPPRLEVVAGSVATSPLAISAKGALKNGVTRTLTRTGAIALQPADVLTLRPGPTDGKDSYTWEANKNTNYGSDDETWVAQGGSNDALALFEFPMGQIPARARISSATLSIHHRSGNDPNVPVTAHRITQPWIEDEVTWNKRDNGNNWNTSGGDFDSTEVAMTLVGPASNIRYEWDLTDLVQVWADGAFPNYGVILRTESAGIFGERFDTSDHIDPTRRPSLTIRFACECGSPCMAPQASGNVLMVIGNSPTNPSPAEASIRDYLESWGYSVSLIEDDDSQGNFTAAAAANDVVFISESVSASNVGSKLTAVPSGVVSAESNLNDELGISTAGGTPVSDSVDVVDNSHYITAIFPARPMTFKTVSTALASVGGTLSPGAQVLAQTGGAGSLVALDSGALGTGGGPSPGRRVLIPVGEANVEWDVLTNEGQLIVQRALEWAGGVGDAVLSGTFLDQFNAITYDGNDGTLDWSDLWLETGESDGPGGGDFRVVGSSWCASGSCLQIREDRASSRQLTREADLTGAGSAILSLSYRRRHVTTPIGGAITLEISKDGGANFTPLKIYDMGTQDAAQMSDMFDIAPYIAANTQIRFSTSNNLFETAMYVDDVLIDTTGTAVAGPIAHWKLDDGTGTIALDFEGGHDGTLTTGGPSWVAGQIGDALSFDGSDDYVDLTSDAELDDVFLGGATVMAWIEPAGWGENGYGRIFDKSSSPSSTGDGWVIRMNVDNGGIINFGQGFSGGRGWWKIPNGSISLDTWQHIAVAYDASSPANDPVIYLNGFPTLVTLVDTPAGAVRSDASINLRLGNYAGGTTHTFDGKIDDARIYDRMLSASEIADIAAGGGGGGSGSGPAFESFEETIDADNDTAAISVNKPAGTAADDLLVAVVVTNRNNESTLVADDPGWTLLTRDAQANAQTVGVWWKVAGGSEPANYGFSWDAAAPARSYSWIMRFSGNDPTNPIHVWDKLGEGTVSSPLSPAVTTTVDDTLILRIGGFDDDDITIGDPGMTGHTPITMQKSNTGTGTVSGGAAYVAQAASGNSGTANFTLTATEQSRTITIGIAPAP